MEWCLRNSMNFFIHRCWSGVCRLSICSYQDAYITPLGNTLLSDVDHTGSRFGGTVYNCFEIRIYPAIFL